ncbi:uncharacterized protein LOC119838932 [Zerene cesonia]|uniref:uncharacterized protein LOC119838932 n=1 Tax=Zerene cesonia TaxID=33412 RepID=UPI0018E581BD|nr:uncharacterized protein LOC119838932 [Zerene cesonia]
MWLGLIIGLRLLNCGFAMDSVPVFIMDFESVLPHVIVDPNPFYKVDSIVFFDIIHEALKNGRIVLMFIEEKFSVEDISIKDTHGSPFFNLRQGLIDGKVKYFPSVAEPYKMLKQVFQHERHNVFYLRSTSSKIQIHKDRYKHYYIYFMDSSNETRAEALRRHDLIMREVYFVIRRMATGPIVAFYTGKTNPIVVEKINFLSMKPSVDKRAPGVTITSTGGLFRLIGVYSTLGSRRSTFSQIPLVAEETWTRRHLNTRMAYTDFELEFSFSFKDEGWIVDNIALLEYGEEVGRTKLGVGAPWRWSYVCGEPLVLVNTRDGSSVIISQYQIQPFHTDLILRNGSEGNDTHCFGPAVHCGPYFNAHILAGLMVTFFCLGILTYGITSLYNCPANDRYDDPQGKQLVIVSDGSH